MYKNAISGRALYVFELEKTGFMGHPPAIEVELGAGRLNLISSLEKEFEGVI